MYLLSLLDKVTVQSDHLECAGKVQTGMYV